MENFKNYFSINTMIMFIEKYRNYILSVFAGIALASAGLGYWYYNRLQLNQAALLAFSEAFTERNKAEKNSELWSELEETSQIGYAQYSATALAPYFLALQVESLLHQNKFDEALDVMNTVMTSLPQSSPLYYSYAIKQARMKMDSSDESISESGFASLKALSEDKNNKNQDEALYYLGMVYADKSDKKSAHEIWTQMLHLYENSSDAVSPWVVQVKKQMARG